MERIARDPGRKHPPREGDPARERIFCACAPGAEELLSAELLELGLDSRALKGGAEAEGDDAAAIACLGSRLSDSVHLRLWEGPKAELKAAKRAAARRAGGLKLLVRARGELATISVDAAGAPLFRRGWRARIGAAPLRETLAACLLRAGGFRGDRPFCDPMCGSGTIAIEAALLAARRAPGLSRPLALEALPGHGGPGLERLRARLRRLERSIAIPIVASDRNAGALRLARRNAAAAGVESAITFERCDAAEAKVPSGAGLCATNPPYGLRLEEGAIEAWRALATLLARLGGWDAAILGPDRGLVELLGPRPSASLRLKNGGLPLRIHLYRCL